MNDYDDEKLYSSPENLFKVLDKMKEMNYYLETCDTKEIHELYVELFPMLDGMYEISEKRMERIHREMTDKTLMKLVDTGLVDMLWDDKVDDFMFRLTEAGKKYGLQQAKRLGLEKEE